MFPPVPFYDNRGVMNELPLPVNNKSDGFDTIAFN